MNRTPESDVPGVHFRRCTAVAARALRGTVEAVYVSSYVEAIASGHSFDSVDAFMSRFDAYASTPTFDMVVAYHDDRAIGQTWGWPLGAGSRWWTGLDAELDPGFTREDGHRTFALSEIMVAEDWTGKGIARSLHDELLATRSERRAVLLVEPDNLAARRAYLRWGWHGVGQLRPDWDDAPAFDVLVKELVPNP